ncbi:MAG: hypothetical protein EZS28_026705 [Streblomastix strix]|uniref:Uncharacterized protein n=1 Tax=Streblomastix strix TaxID=222440 RepID=A0A5J4V4R1_9EUKA|nr:MAG: hypothetical protein EZS28_026705 [Streblomastix strix]
MVTPIATKQQARNTASNEVTTRVWLNDCYGQEPDQTRADSRVLDLKDEHQNNDNSNDNIPKERSIEAAKISEGTSQEKKYVRTKDLASVIGKIQCTLAQFRRGALYIKQLQKLKDKEVASRG